jgi:hypothetical protein
MGKLFNSLIISGIVSIVLLLLNGSGVLGTVAQIFINPTSHNFGNLIYDAFTNALGALTAAGAVAIFIGTFVIRLDWLIRAGMFTILESWISAPLVALWSFFNSQLASLPGCKNGAICSSLTTSSLGGATLGSIIAGFIVGPLIIYSTWSCIEYVWSGDR